MPETLEAMVRVLRVVGAVITTATPTIKVTATIVWLANTVVVAVAALKAVGVVTQAVPVVLARAPHHLDLVKLFLVEPQGMVGTVGPAAAVLMAVAVVMRVRPIVTAPAPGIAPLDAVPVAVVVHMAVAAVIQDAAVLEVIAAAVAAVVVLGLMAVVVAPPVSPAAVVVPAVVVPAVVVAAAAVVAVVALLTLIEVAAVVVAALAETHWQVLVAAQVEEALVAPVTLETPVTLEVRHPLRPRLTV